MTGHVSLEVNLNALHCAIELDLLNLLRAKGQIGSVCSLRGKLRQGGNFKRPRLRVSHVEMKAVHLVVRASVDHALNVSHLEPIARYIHVEATVRKLGRICNLDRSKLGVNAALGVLVE